MSAPPGIGQDTAVGGSWDTDRSKEKLRDAAIVAAHAALSSAGVPMSPSKVNRLIKKFDRAARKHGATFYEFLVNEAHLPAAAVRAAMGNPDWQRVVAYADPTGETAVNNIMKGVRRG